MEEWSNGARCARLMQQSQRKHPTDNLPNSATIELDPTQRPKPLLHCSISSPSVTSFVMQVPNS